MRSMTVLMCLLPTAAVAQTASSLSFEQQARGYEEVIATIGKFDTKHPDYLNVQLDYATLLARNADAACVKRLADAESHLKVATDSPAINLVLSAAPGRVPFVAYTVEAARARCAADIPRKNEALRNALRYAKQGVEGYRSIFAYDSMVIMQFNVAQAYMDLGDKPLGIKELEAAIAMDRTFGLKEDAAENFRVLRTWQGKPASDAEVAALLKSLAPRSVTLKFDWKPFQADMTSSYDLASFEPGGARHTTFTVPSTSQLKVEGEDLLLENYGGEPKFESKLVGSNQDQQIAALLARVFAKVPSIRITKQGQFKALHDPEGFSKSISADVDRMLTKIVPEGDMRLPQLKTAVDQTLGGFIAPDNLRSKYQQQFTLETSMWIGATLLHNQWLQLPLTLPMNGTPQGFIDEALDMTLARWLPCTKGMKPDSCVELIVHGKPTEAALKQAAENLEKAGSGTLEYSSETRLRLVVDPNTMMVYENESFEFSYLSLANKAKRAIKIDANHRSTQYRYHK